MSFNRSRYNLQPFNNGSITTRKVSAFFSETVSQQTKIGADYRVSAALAELISVSANGLPFVIITASMSETISSAVTGISTVKAPVEISESVNISGVGFSCVIVGASLKEQIQAAVNGLSSVIVSAAAAENISALAAGLSIIFTGAKFNELISAAIQTGAAYAVKAAMAESIEGEIAPAADVRILEPRFFENIDVSGQAGAGYRVSGTLYELISETASIEATETKVCVLNVTLQPGQRLIIDASNYNIMLDDQNMMKIHSGDWIDELSRETIAIDIVAASGANNLEASILYTERFL